jgi:hypothetical protein
MHDIKVIEWKIGWVLMNECSLTGANRTGNTLVLL